MKISCLLRSPVAHLFAAFILLFASRPALAQADGYVLYLNEYLTGDYYYAPLSAIDSESPPLVNSRQLRLPRGFRRGVELGNADVSIDGTTIVFAARSTVDLDWDIYTGTIDRFRRRIRNVQGLIQTAGGRDEDPRVSWDGASVVYKCDGNICIYPEIYPNPVVESWCELWAPSFDPAIDRPSTMTGEINNALVPVPCRSGAITTAGGSPARSMSVSTSSRVTRGRSAGRTRTPRVA